MILLGIESSCDETARRSGGGRPDHSLSSVIASQVEEPPGGGAIATAVWCRKSPPARHSEAIVGVVKEALAQGGKDLSEIGGIAVTYAPGLIGALLVGVNFAKGLSLSTGLPLIPGCITCGGISPPITCPTQS